MHKQTFFPTLKSRPEFLNVKNLGLSWASASFIIQGLLEPSQSSHAIRCNNISNKIDTEVVDVDSDSVKQKFCTDKIDETDKLAFINTANISVDSSTQPSLQQIVNNTVPIKIGYVVTKKIGNAVKRNRAKRRLRELCKSGAHLFQDIPAQYVIIARHPVLTQPFDELLKQLAWTLKHLYRIHSEVITAATKNSFPRT